MGNTNALKSGRHSPRFKAVLTAMSQVPEVQAYLAALRRQQRRTKRMAAGELHPALLEVMQRAPTRSNPPPRLSAEDTPWANRPSKGPGRQSIKGESSNSLGKGALARKQLLFYPPASFKRRQKTQSDLTKGD